MSQAHQESLGNRWGPCRVFASRLEVFLLFIHWQKHWAVPESQQSLCLVPIFDCRLFLDVSALTCDLEDNREHAQEESSNNRLTVSPVTHPKSVRNFHQKSPLRHYLSPTFWAFLRSTFPSFPPFPIPHLEWGPDVDQGEGEIACLAIRSEGGCGVHREKMLERH